MKKELIILNKLSPLFNGNKYYKIEYCVQSDEQSMIYIEIDYKEEDLIFVKNILNDTVVNDYEILLDLPTVDMDLKPINKCFMIIFNKK